MKLHNGMEKTSFRAHTKTASFKLLNIKKLFLNSFIAFVLVFNLLNVSNAERIEILMSNVTTQQEDAYICTSYKLADDQRYISMSRPLSVLHKQLFYLFI